MSIILIIQSKAYDGCMHAEQNEVNSSLHLILLLDRRALARQRFQFFPPSDPIPMTVHPEYTPKGKKPEGGGRLGAALIWWHEYSLNGTRTTHEPLLIPERQGLRVAHEN